MAANAMRGAAPPSAPTPSVTCGSKRGPAACVRKCVTQSTSASRAGSSSATKAEASAAGAAWSSRRSSRRSCRRRIAAPPATGRRRGRARLRRRRPRRRPLGPHGARDAPAGGRAGGGSPRLRRRRGSSSWRPRGAPRPPVDVGARRRAAAAQPDAAQRDRRRLRGDAAERRQDGVQVGFRDELLDERDVRQVSVVEDETAGWRLEPRVQPPQRDRRRAGRQQHDVERDEPRRSRRPSHASHPRPAAAALGNLRLRLRFPPGRPYWSPGRSDRADPGVRVPPAG